MNFKAVLETLITDFDTNGIGYALIGGLAVSLWSVPRSTVDVDFLILKDDVEPVAAIMEKHGYECRYRTENVSQYVSPLRIFGEVDYLHAFRDASVAMLKRTAIKNIFSGALKINVLQPEDLIGLKLQAMKNDPGRTSIDTADIKALMQVHGGCLDLGLIKKYFELFETDFSILNNI